MPKDMHAAVTSLHSGEIPAGPSRGKMLDTAAVGTLRQLELYHGPASTQQGLSSAVPRFRTLDNRAWP